MFQNSAQRVIHSHLQNEVLLKFSSSIIKNYNGKGICTIKNLPDSYSNLLFKHYSKRDYRKDEWMRNVQLLSSFSFGSLLGFSSSTNSKSQTNAAGEKKLSFTEKTVAPDGNCMFRALSHQLFQTEEKHKQVRAEIISWLRKNANFAIDDSGTKLSDFLDVDRYRSWDGFCSRMSKDATWGDHLCLVAAAEVYKATIRILSTSGPRDNPWIVIEPKQQSEKILYLKHYHEMHYNSLVVDNSPTQAKL